MDIRKYFNPRTPCGVRLVGALNPLEERGISIHAPLAGCDRRYQRHRRCQGHFNPRTPCGVRLLQSGKMSQQQLFQSTHPLRGATNPLPESGTGRKISIHAPLAGCDAETRSASLENPYFNPRTPCGVRLSVLAFNYSYSSISIHAPLAGCDNFAVGAGLVAFISIHAPLAGCDGTTGGQRCQRQISIHAPLAGCDGFETSFILPNGISIHAPLAGCDSKHAQKVPYTFAKADKRNTLSD